MLKLVIIKNVTSKSIANGIIEIFSKSAVLKDYKEVDNLLIILYYETGVAIELIEKTIIEELLINVWFFNSKQTYTLINAERVDYLCHILSLLPVSSKLILSENDLIMLKEKELLPKHIFGKYYKNNDILKTVYTYLCNSFNATLTANELYLHRNTVNQRIEKFSIETGVSFKNFEDCFCLYFLLRDYRF